jgi:tRNA pseudouridine55 synthase
MHSALKCDGRPLYRLAREGASVERAPRRVVVHELEWLGREGDILRLRIHCSKGTYVRTLVEDLGSVLETGAHLAALRRTGAGRFGVGQAVTLQELAALEPAERERRVLPLASLLEGLPSLILPGASAARFRQGQAVPQPGSSHGRYRVSDADGRFLGVGEIAADGLLRPRRLIASG